MVNFFVSPVFGEMIEVLSLGFGISIGRKNKLSELRSFGGKQKQYSTSLQPALIELLAAGDARIARDLAWRLGQIEYLAARLRGAHLFSPASPDRAFQIFFVTWVAPHLAALLNDFRARASPASPLYHLPDLLPRREDPDDYIIQATKQRVRACLGAELKAPLFMQELDRLDGTSTKKNLTIEREIKELGDEIRHLLPEEELAQRLQHVRAAYLAGAAVKRFLDLAPNFLRLPLRALGACIDDEFDAPEHGDQGLCATHVRLYDDMAESLAACLNTELPEFKVIDDWYREQLGAREPEDVPAFMHIVQLFEAPKPDAAKIAACLRRAEAHPDHALFASVSLLFKARLAMYQGELEASLCAYKEIIALSEYQQLGELEHEAAGCAIALEVLLRSEIVTNSLEPLVLHRAQSQPQQWSLTIPLPTPFSSFGGISELPAGIRQVFEAIAEFNVGYTHMHRRADWPVCNPLHRLDQLLAQYFDALDQQHLLYAQPQKAARKAVTLVFKRRTRSVMSICGATPYEALRDCWSYLRFFFGEEFLSDDQLNPHLMRFIQLRTRQKWRLLKALDGPQYRADINAVKKLKRQKAERLASAR